MAVQQVIPEKRGALEKIMQGLQVAQSVVGLKSAYDQMKINDMKMKEYEKEKAQQERRKSGVFTQEEYDQMYRVPEIEDGVSIGWVDKIKRNEKGGVIYDPSTGQPETQREKFYYVDKNNALTKSYLTKNLSSQQVYDREKWKAEGGLTTEELKGFDVSFKPKDNYAKSKIRDPFTGETVPVWVRPKSKDGEITTGGMGNPLQNVKIPEWAKAKPDLKEGFAQAVFEGVDPAKINPELALKYSPSEINKSVEDYKKKMAADDTINFYRAVADFDKTIGIDAAKNQDGTTGSVNSQIAGVTDWSGKSRDIPLLGEKIGNFTADPQGNINDSVVQKVQNMLLSKRSGAAVSAQEAERLAKELGSALGKRDPALIRRAMAEIRAAMAQQIDTLMLNMPEKAKKVINNSKAINPYSELFTGIDSKDDAVNRVIGGN